jgi:alanine racemase
MNETSYIEINQTALQNNIQFIKNIIGANCELISVIKGNAYGHGIKNIAPILSHYNVKSFAVFSAFEAHKIVDSKTDYKRIIIMGDVDDSLEWAIKNDIEFFVFDENRLSETIVLAKKLDKKATIHIEIETGLNRTGFTKKELKKIIPLIKLNENHLIVEGICSHLAGAEDIANYFRINKQISNFNTTLKYLKKENIHFKNAHLACSAAIMNYPKTINTMTRVGIMQYGFWPSKQVKVAYLANQKDKTDPLQRVISWKSKVMSIKTVNEGEYIGYGNSCLTETKTKIATIPVGYAHGFSRSLSNQGKVLINGTRVDIVGIVNMNMLIADITNLTEVKKGDEVVLIGEQNGQSISVASFSDLSNQLNYELLTRLPNDIPRILTK